MFSTLSEGVQNQEYVRAGDINSKETRLEEKKSYLIVIYKTLSLVGSIRNTNKFPEMSATTYMLFSELLISLLLQANTTLQYFFNLQSIFIAGNGVCLNCSQTNLLIRPIFLYNLRSPQLAHQKTSDFVSSCLFAGCESKIK